MVQSLPEHQRVRLVTYMNQASDEFGYLQVSAAEHELYPQILGYGEKAWWPEGLGAKINALRRVVYSDVPDQELVLFVDAYDILVFGGRAEIVAGFEALEKANNRSLFFSAEQSCFPHYPDVCTDDYPKGQDPRWRYLNSGAVIGRGFALREMLKEPVDNVMEGGDQAFYQRYRRNFPDRVGLDTNCVVLCTFTGLGEVSGLELRDRRIVNKVTRTQPSVVHFVGPAHWPFWTGGGERSSQIYEVFSGIYPDADDRLFKVVTMSLRVGAVYRSSLEFRGARRHAYLRFMRSELCVRCRFTFSHDRDCEVVAQWGSDTCSEVRWSLLVISILLAVCLVAYRFRMRQRELKRMAEQFSKSEKAV